MQGGWPVVADSLCATTRCSRGPSGVSPDPPAGWWGGKRPRRPTLRAARPRAGRTFLPGWAEPLTLVRLMRPPATSASRRVEPPVGSVPRSGSCGGGPPRPSGSAAGHTPGSTRDAGCPAGHNTSASPRRAEVPPARGLGPADTAPTPPAWPGPTAHTPARRGTPAAARVAASAGRTPRAITSAACACPGPAHPGPGCRHSETSPSARPRPRSARA